MSTRETRERGLEPLADYLRERTAAPLDLIELAKSLVDPAKEVPTIEDALEGARHIVAERISEDAEMRSTSRKSSRCTMSIVSR